MNFIKPGLEVLNQIIKIESIPRIILNSAPIILEKQVTRLLTNTNILEPGGIIGRNDRNPLNIIKLYDLIPFIDPTVSFFYRR
jgi:hypothetical protein